MDFQDVRGLTLLSFKYDVQHIQTEAIRRLKVCFPATLGEWDARYSDTKRNSTAPDTLRAVPIDAIAALNLARRFDLRALVPAALYICARGRPEELIADVRYGPDDVESLSHADLAACLRGLAFLQAAPRVQSTHGGGHYGVAAFCAQRDRGSCMVAWAAICGHVLGDRSTKANDIFRDVVPLLEEHRTA